MVPITVRQTRDPFCAITTYVAYCKVTLEDNGDLKVNNISFSKLKNRLIVRSMYYQQWFELPTNCDDTVTRRNTKGNFIYFHATTCSNRQKLYL
jgi:hypothetical protein